MIQSSMTATLEKKCRNLYLAYCEALDRMDPLNNSEKNSLLETQTIAQNAGLFISQWVCDYGLTALSAAYLSGSTYQELEDACERQWQDWKARYRLLAKQPSPLP
jgi:hypothetical protein